VFTARYGLGIYVQFMKIFVSIHGYSSFFSHKRLLRFYIAMHNTITGNVVVRTDQSVLL